MKNLLTNFKLWIGVSACLLLMVIFMIIFASSNFYQLEDYKTNEKQVSNQTEVVNKLTEENADLQQEKQANIKSDDITKVVNEFIMNFYDDDGLSSANQRARKVQKYVTPELFDKIYDKDLPDTQASTKRSVMISPTIETIVWDNTGNYNAKSLATVILHYDFEDAGTEETRMFLDIDLTYDKETTLWNISSVRTTTNVNLKELGGKT